MGRKEELGRCFFTFVVKPERKTKILPFSFKQKKISSFIHYILHPYTKHILKLEKKEKN